ELSPHEGVDGEIGVKVQIGFHDFSFAGFWRLIENLSQKDCSCFSRPNSRIRSRTSGSSDRKTGSRLIIARVSRSGGIVSKSFIATPASSLSLRMTAIPAKVVAA